MVTRPEDALKALGVSRETIERLRIHEQQLLKWRKVKNLVGPATFAEVWTRHFLDSLQLRFIAPEARTWIDIGSGAGFPGLVVAADLASYSDARVHLIEADHRRCAFLRETARAMDCKVEVHYGRAEDILPHLHSVDVITARAVASLSVLVNLAAPLVDKGAKCLFPKGRGYQAELTELVSRSTVRTEIIPSLTDPAAAVIRVTGKISPHLADAKGA